VSVLLENGTTTILKESDNHGWDRKVVINKFIIKELAGLAYSLGS